MLVIGIIVFILLLGIRELWYKGFVYEYYLYEREVFLFINLDSDWELLFKFCL